MLQHRIIICIVTITQERKLRKVGINVTGDDNLSRKVLELLHNVDGLFLFTYYARQQNTYIVKYWIVTDYIFIDIILEFYFIFYCCI